MLLNRLLIKAPTHNSPKIRKYPEKSCQDNYNNNKNNNNNNDENINNNNYNNHNNNNILIILITNKPYYCAYLLNYAKYL